MPRMRIAAAAAALVALCSSAAAQDWPTRPVTMVVPFAAGGAFDVLARVFAPYLSMSLGQQVIVENVGAAAGGERHHHGHRPGRPVLRRSGRA